MEQLALNGTPLQTVDVTGQFNYVDENGDGLFGNSDTGSVAQVDAQNQSQPPSPTPAPTQPSSGFDWKGLLNTAVTSLVSPSSSPQAVQAAATVAAQAQAQKKTQSNTIWVIVAVVVVVGILLYFVFKKSK